MQRNDKFAESSLDSAVDCNADSANLLAMMENRDSAPMAQNDNFILNFTLFAESSLDSAESQNLGKNNLARSANPCKSFCYFWLLPKVESPLSFNYNLPNKVVLQNLPKSPQNTQ